MRHTTLFIASSSIFLALVACQRASAPVKPASNAAASASSPVADAPAASMSPASASAPARGAPDDSKEALMQEAFPDWGGERPYVMTVADPDSKGNDPVTVAAWPEQVVTLDVTHRVLAVSGTISDEAGHLGGAHAQPGNLGAYWFELRGGRWFATHRRDSILWAGSSGNLGSVKLADLGPTKHALAVESGWCGQGYCVGALDLLEVGADAAPVVLTVAPLSTESLGVAEGCKEFLDGGTRLAPAVIQALGPDNCFDTGGKWRIEPRANADRGDVVVEFAGHELVEDPSTHAKSARKVAEAMVFRYSGKSYKPVSGRNPSHPV